MTTIAPEDGSSSWHHDAAADTAEMASDYDSGLERFDAIGIAAGMKVSERYSIAAADPLSARASLAWTIKREPDLFTVDTSLEVAVSVPN